MFKSCGFKYKPFPALPFKFQTFFPWNLWADFPKRFKFMALLIRKLTLCTVQQEFSLFFYIFLSATSFSMKFAFFWVKYFPFYHLILSASMICETLIKMHRLPSWFTLCTLPQQFYKSLDFIPYLNVECLRWITSVWAFWVSHWSFSLASFVQSRLGFMNLN